MNKINAARLFGAKSNARAKDIIYVYRDSLTQIVYNIVIKL